MTVGTLSYPKRPKFFAVKFSRLVLKACVANELGADAAMLLVAVATTEDARGYRGAVNFWNTQLAPLIGCRSDSAFKRVRAKCERAGWLVCVPGSKWAPPSYWVTVPPQFDGWDDGATDEGDADAGEGDQGPPVGGERAASGRRAGGERPDSFPIPFPIPEDPLPPESTRADPPTSPRRPPRIGDVIDYWNSKPDLPKVRARSPGWSRFLMQLAEIDGFCDGWQTGIDNLAGSPHHRGENQGRWMATLDWYLKPENYVKAANMATTAAPPRPARRITTIADLNAADQQIYAPKPLFVPGGHRVG